MQLILLIMVVGCLMPPASAADSESHSSVSLSPEEIRWIENHRVIRLAPDPAFHPFEFFDDSGSFRGIAADFMLLMEKKLGLHFEVVHLKNWVEVLDQIKTGKVDMISAVMKTKERSEFLNFSEPYLRFPYVIVARDENRQEFDLQSLKGKKVAVVNKYAIHDLLESDHPELNLIPVADFSEGLRGVSFGTYDVFVANLASLSYNIGKEGIGNLRVAGESGYFINLSMVVRKDFPELIPILDKGLKMISEQERTAIFDKWIKLVEPSTRWWQLSREQFIVVFSIFIGLLVIGILAWNYQLRKTVHKRTAALLESQTRLERHKDELEEKVAERTEELKEANKTLLELDRLKSLFISSMSHEMRTPLNAIIGFTSVVEQGMTGEVNEQQKEQLHRSLEASRKLLQIVQEAIDLSEIEAGFVKPEFQIVSILSLAEDAMQKIRAKAEKKSLQLNIDVPKELTINTDRHRFEQCVMNLLTNAEKYTESGSITLSANRADQGTVIINVTDTGIGISKDDKGKIFAPFHRLDSPLSVVAGGTGLGLYLTRKICTSLLQGEVSVESTLGKGSVFALRLPIRQEIDGEK